MRRRLRSTRTRLTITYTAVFGLAMVVVSVLSWLALAAQSMSQLDVALTSELQAAKSQLSAYAATAAQHKDPPSTGTSLTTLAHNGTAVSVVAWSGTRFLAASSGADHSPAARDWAVANDPGAGGDPSILTSPLDGGLRLLVAHVQNHTLSATLVLSTPLSPYAQQLLRTGLTLSLAVTLLTILSAIVSYRIAAAALRPIHGLATKAHQLTEHNIDEPISFDAPSDEVGELAATLETMRRRLAQSFEDQRRLRADTAHELRTPLAMLQAEIEVTLGHDRTQHEYRESLNALLTDVGHLNDIVSRLLLVSRAEAEALEPDRQAVDLHALVQHAVGRAANLGGNRVAVALLLPAFDHCVVRGDGTLLRQALDNVLANAIRHAARDVVVSMSINLEENGDTHVLVRVDDDGTGIPVSSRADVVKPFRRLDAGRSRGSGGAGLGLAVSDAIVQAHHGSLEIEDSASGGASVVLRFPCDSYSQCIARAGTVGDVRVAAASGSEDSISHGVAIGR